MAEAHINLAYILQEIDNTEEAVEHYRQALLANPNHINAYGYLVRAYVKLGRSAEDATISLLADKDPEVQDAAIIALGKIGGPEAKRTLQKLGKSTDMRIKNAAKAALVELTACEDPISLNF